MCCYYVKQPADFPRLTRNLKRKVDKAHLPPLALKKVSPNISKRLFMTSVPLLVLVTGM